MIKQDFESDSWWHSPDRAWVPILWIIGAVALGLSLVLFAPLLPAILALQ